MVQPKRFLTFEINGLIQSYRCALLVPRILELDVDYGVNFDRNPTAPLKDIALDPIESRYLLSGSSTGAISIHDTGSSDALVTSGQLTYPRVSPFLSSPNQRGTHSRLRNLSPVICVQWYPVDSGLFFTASVDKRIRLWDANKFQCVDTIELQESLSWIALSDCSHTHNLIGASLGPNGTGRAVLVDPLISAVAITLTGGHSQAGLSQLCWSPRSSHMIITSGFDGRVLFWDIRATRKPVFSLDRYLGPDSLPYSTEATAHTGPVLGLAHSPDGLHLFTWGGAGASENTLCLRMWSSAPGDRDLPYYHNSDAPSLSTPQLRPVNFGIMYSESAETHSAEPATSSSLDPLTPREQQGPRTQTSLSMQSSGSQPVRSKPQWTPVRLGTTWCPSGEAWGARSAFVFVPCRSRLLIALATRQGAPTRLINRHYSKIRSCVWNHCNKELYTCGMDGNLFTWPLFPHSCDTSDTFNQTQ